MAPVPFSEGLFSKILLWGEAKHMRLENKVIAVTGGADGIGRALAFGAAREGAAAVLADIDAAKLEQTKSDMRAAGLSCETYRMDASDEEQIEAVVAGLLQKFGRIDGWVNNAGVSGKTALLETSSAEFDKVISVNLKGVFLCCRAVGRVMAGQGHGSIVNIASVAGRSGGGLMGTSVYAASKGGVIAFTKGIARELAPVNVRVNAIAPGSIDTPMTTVGRDPESYAQSLRKIPLRRRGNPEELVGAAVLLLSDESSFMTGATLDVNGGSFMY